MKTTLKVPLALAVGPIISSILIPVAVAAYIFNEFVRSVVRTLLFLKYGFNLQLLEASRDARWVSSGRLNTSSRYTLVVAVTRREEDLNVRQYAREFERQVLLHEDPNYKRKGLLGKLWGLLSRSHYRPYEKLESITATAYGYPCWKLYEHFDVLRHFRSLEEDREYNQEDLARLLSDLHEDMDARKPQWEWVFVPKYKDAQDEEKSVQIFRYNHAYMDEMSLQLLLSRYLTTNKNVTLYLNPMEAQPETWKKVVVCINTFVYGPFFLLSTLLGQNTQSSSTPPPTLAEDSPIKVSVASSPSLDLSLFEKIRARTDASVPHIILNSFLYGLKRILSPQNAILGSKSARISEVISMTPFENYYPQNNFSVFSFKVPAAPRHDANAKELNEAIITLRRERLGGMSGPEILLTYHALSYIYLLPTFVVRLLEGLGLRRTLATINSVPSCAGKLKIFGSDWEELGFFHPVTQHAGITFGSSTYDKSLKLTCTANSSILNQDQLERLLQEVTRIILAIAEHGHIPVTLPPIIIPRKNLNNELPPPKSSPLPQEPYTNQELLFTESSLSEAEEDEEEQDSDPEVTQGEKEQEVGKVQIISLDSEDEQKEEEVPLVEEDDGNHEIVTDLESLPTVNEDDLISTPAKDNKLDSVLQGENRASRRRTRIPRK